MITKLVFLSLLFACSFSTGLRINGEEPLSIDFFSCIHQTYPDYVEITMEHKINWAQFRQNYLNALIAGYQHIHVAIPSWKVLQKDSLPEDFNGRVWISSAMTGEKFSFDPKLVQDLLYGEEKKEFMNTALSSFLLYSEGEGSKCTSISRGAKTEQCGKTFEPLTLNAECI